MCLLHMRTYMVQMRNKNRTQNAKKNGEKSHREEMMDEIIHLRPLVKTVIDIVL